MSQTQKIKLNIPVIVEGKYDKIALSSVIDAHIITTDGFGLFNNAEKRALIKRLSENGIIVLCDSDGAGGLIRSRISSLVPKDKLYQLYTPRIEGKEKRKSAPSAEGVLGVEGMSTQTLHDIFTAFLAHRPQAEGDACRGEAITKLDFYESGLSGGVGSREKRDAVAKRLGLPDGMSANALLAAVNLIITKEEFESVVSGGNS